MNQFVNKNVSLPTQIKVVKTLGGITIGLGFLTVLSMAENLESVGFIKATIGVVVGIAVAHLGARGWDHAAAYEIKLSNHVHTYAAQPMQNIIACDSLNVDDGLVIGF